MRASRHQVRPRLVIGAWLTLLMVGLAAPATSRADCSHRADRPAIGLDESPRRDAPLRPASIRPTEATPPPKPCTGPQCSGKSAPVPATAATEVAPAGQWAFVPLAAPPAEPDVTSTRVIEVATRPIWTPSSVFHPPRRPR